MTPHDPHAIVEIGSEVFDSWEHSQLFDSLNIELTTNQASQAEWRIVDPDFKRLDGWTAAGGGIAELPVKVRIGFGASLGAPVFTGVIGRVEWGGGLTTLRAYDAGFKMRKVQKTEYHKGTALQIIAKLARRNGLQFEGPDPAVKLDNLKSAKQEGDTDWAYALGLAEESGFVLFVRGTTLYAKEAAKTAASPVLTLTYQDDFVLLDEFDLVFSVPENQEGRPSRVETRARNQTGRRLKGQSGQHQRGTEVLIVKRDLRVRSKQTADRRAEARKALQREHAFDCHVTILPTFRGKFPDVRETVALARLGKLFTGKYLIDRAGYRFAAGELSGNLDLYADIK
ncbi:MAG TPA: hypothetical protein VIP46_22520 [Pyrinomonadaceae bacterium]